MPTCECSRCWRTVAEDDCTYVVTERQTFDNPEDGVLLCSKCQSDIESAEVERGLEAAEDRNYPKHWRNQ